jgi:hypothetical protein
MQSTQRRLLVLAAIGVLVLVTSRIPVETGSVPKETSSSAPLSPSDLETIHRDIRRLQVAIFEEDVETVLRLAHPRWIQAIGGHDKVREEIESLGSRQLAATHQIEFEQTVFGDEPAVRRTTEHEFVIVPSLCAFRRPGDRFEVPTFDVAVRRIGTTNWRYIGGTEFDEQQAVTLFPDFPKDSRFPQKAVRVVGR